MYIISTQQAAQQYLDSQILFYTEDFKDGSFPVKNCNNCSKYIRKGVENKPYYICANGEFTGLAPKDKICNVFHQGWQGELKGESIRKGDKCWRSDISGYSYQDWTTKVVSLISHVNMKVKYFSNETNARNYYNKLQEENKPKFVENKRYYESFQKLYAIYEKTNSNLEKFLENIWSNDVTTQECMDKYYQNS